MQRLMSLSLLFCLSLPLMACGGNFPAVNPQPSGSPSAKPTAKPTAQPSALPSAAPGISDSQAKYSLPLTLKSEGECDMPNVTAYQISPEGKMTYLDDLALVQPGEPMPTVTRQLTDKELIDLIVLIENLDFVALKAQSQPVPDDAPQTMECRSVEILEIQHAGEKAAYDRNSRKLRHSEAYLAAFEQVKERLSALKTAHQNDK
jgi:hypothetical protein